MARQLKVNAMSLGILMRALHEGPHSYKELAEITGLHYATIRDWVNALHDQGVVHIAAYERDARDRDSVRLWQYGIDKRDAKKRKLTGAQRQARQREKKESMKVLQMMAGAST